MDTNIQIASIIHGDSVETLRKAIAIARKTTAPDEQITRTFITSPGGVERQEVRAFRLGDYFDRIELLPSESGNSASFTLTFCIRNGVDSSWKALLVAVLRTISEGVPGVKTSILPGSGKT